MLKDIKVMRVESVLCTGIKVDFIPEMTQKLASQTQFFCGRETSTLTG